MAKVFIGGLSWNTNDDSLRSAFEKYGEITDARVIVDRNTGRSRGFGFVSFAELDCARDAISAMNNKELDGREVRVDLAQDRPEGGSRGGRSGPYDRPSYGGGGRRDYGGGNWRDNNGGGRGGYRGGRDGDDGGSRREYSGSRGGRDYESRSSSNRSYDD